MTIPNRVRQEIRKRRSTREQEEADTLAIALFQTVLWLLFRWAMRRIDGFCKNTKTSDRLPSPQTETWATADWKAVCVCIRALCGCIVLYGQSIKSVMFANRLRIKDLKYKNNYHYLYYTEDIKAVKFFCKKTCFIFDILSIHVLL